ncbi:MAG TPA: recombination protein RecR [Anaerolineae bacterium]|nr:recombination protein RecR [Caldilineae bacterium]HID33468.1 recombination protein RecR [Anaerolineae bacterium]HIQ11517.1 recombination protein RecR [Caldilineales bacterium]
MHGVAEPIQRLIEAFERLPGIGPKSASRIAFHLLRAPDEQVQELADAIASLKESIVYCSRCQNLSQMDPCAICSDPARDQHLVCVVEDPLDVVAIERTGAFKGLYHVLHGAINPVEGVGPEDLRVDALLERLEGEPIDEIIIATNPNMEGEATAMYLARLFHPKGVRVTRLARGLPVGGDLEYADEVTLSRALEGRRDI